MIFNFILPQSESGFLTSPLWERLGTPECGATFKCAGSTLNSCHATSENCACVAARRAVKTNTLPSDAISGFRSGAAGGGKKKESNDARRLVFMGTGFAAWSFGVSLVINMLLLQPRWGCSVCGGRDQRVRQDLLLLSSSSLSSNLIPMFSEAATPDGTFSRPNWFLPFRPTSSTAASGQGPKLDSGTALLMHSAVSKPARVNRVKTHFNNQIIWTGLTWVTPKAEPLQNNVPLKCDPLSCGNAATAEFK